MEYVRFSGGWKPQRKRLITNTDTGGGVASGVTIATLAIPKQTAPMTYLMTLAATIGNGAGAQQTIGLSNPTLSAGTVNLRKNVSATLGSGGWGEGTMIAELSVPENTDSTLTIKNGAQNTIIWRCAITVEATT